MYLFELWFLCRSPGWRYQILGLALLTAFFGGTLRLSFGVAVADMHSHLPMWSGDSLLQAQSHIIVYRLVRMAI